MATQVGPMMRRVKIHGKDMLLPADVVLEESYPVSGTREDKDAWLASQEDTHPFKLDGEE